MNNERNKTSELRNGNNRGNLTNVPRCGAKTRRNSACKCPAMSNGRCRLHGGLSTGPKTRAGIERIQRANTRHGRYSQVAQAERMRNRELIKQANATLNQLRDEFAQRRRE